LADGESISSHSKPAISTPSDTQDAQAGKENTIAAADVFLAVKALKAGKAICDGIRPEMQALNRGGPWLTRVSEVA